MHFELRVWVGDATPVVAHRLGSGDVDGELPQIVVPAGAWQAARPLGAWTLVGCIVSPAFEFDGFELAPDSWEPPAPGG
jgi:predicted cupin superfamily sugar epimerase